jgi:hypothetical protein
LHCRVIVCEHPWSHIQGKGDGTYSVTAHPADPEVVVDDSRKGSCQSRVDIVLKLELESDNTTKGDSLTGTKEMTSVEPERKLRWGISGNAFSSRLGSKHLQGSHVQVDHSLDRDARALVRPGNGLASEQTSLLTSVKVELNRYRRLESVGDEDSEGLHQVDDAAAVVISTRGTSTRRVALVDRVKVSTKDHSCAGGVCAGEAGDDGLL